MAVVRGRCAILQCLLLFASVTLFPTGFSCSLCNMKLQYRDFGVVLQWDCPTLPPNTSFTVRTRTQGENKWSSLAECVRVTSRICNLSEAFQYIYLYNMVQLETEVIPGSLYWNGSLKVDLNSAMVFSPPSLTVSVNQTVLTVKVQFPTSRNRRLCPQRNNCPVSVVVQPLTTILVYNKKQPSKCQTRTLQAASETLNCNFEMLEAGHEYCAKANFTSSNFSSPYCIYMPFQGLVLNPLPIMLGLWCGLLLTGIFVWIRRIAVPRHQRLPWTLGSLQDEVSREQWVCQEDCEGDHLSILSLSFSSSASVAPVAFEVLADQHSLENGYRSNLFLLDSDSGQTDLASRETADLAGSGYDANPVYWPCEHTSTQSEQSGTSPPPECDWELPVRETSHLRPWDVPLGSVRLATTEAGVLEEWNHLSGLVGPPDVAQLADPGIPEPQM